MRQGLLGYMFAGLFFGMEAFVRAGERARSLQASETDRGSTRLVGLSYGASLLLAPLLNRFRVGQLRSGALGWLGVAFAALGLTLRLWAMRSLGQFYTRTLLVTGEQHIVEEGPYSLIRHPGYAGSLAIWIGIALALQNWLAALVTGCLMLPAYWHRIRAEEAMLKNALGEQYEQYRSRTRRLVPFVY